MFPIKRIHLLDKEYPRDTYFLTTPDEGLQSISRPLVTANGARSKEPFPERAIY